MTTTFKFGDVVVQLTKKSVKNIHLSVHPPDGRVTLVAPLSTRLDVARAYAASKIEWIRKQQTALKNQKREPRRKFVGRESYYLWGRHHLLQIAEKETKPCVRLDHRTIQLTVRPRATTAKKAEIIHNWHLSLMHREVPVLIAKWEKKLKVKVRKYFLQTMKTKWGSCNPKSRTIRLNTELVKKPKDLLEYVVVHELIHLIEPRHSPKFFELMTKHYPSWPEARKELNDLPLSN